MNRKQRLPSEYRNFLTLVTNAVLQNPFMDERDRLLIKILSDIVRLDPNQRIRLDTIKPIIDMRLNKLKRRGIKNLKQIHPLDYEVLRDALLLQCYMRHMKEFDQLIETQLHLGKDPAEVPFSVEVLKEMWEVGLTRQDSWHYFALFYQMRRAFYFIHSSLIGECPCIKQLRLSLWNNVFTQDIRTYDRLLWDRMEDFSTILLGETGTGKGSAAASIGRSGYIPFEHGKNRFKKSFTEIFTAIALSEYSENLIESELFGHRKGSFTGALDHHKGLLERCSAHGALFIDEIGDLIPIIQTKLLKVLQERTFYPVGSRRQKNFRGRVIAATNRPIDRLRREGVFRNDFFYRLCSDIIVVPTLRQRLEESPSELELLVDHLVIRLTGRESHSSTDMILETLKRDLPDGYPWPGNVRELEQAVRRIFLCRHYYGDELVSDRGLEDDLSDQINRGTVQAKELLRQYCVRLYHRFGTFEEVSRKTGLDSRTVKKYLQNK